MRRGCATFPLRWPLRCLLGGLLAGAFGAGIAQPPQFVESAQAAGIDFIHESGARGKLWTLEITGAGVGIVDFDNDGWMDIWLVQGGPIDERTAALPNECAVVTVRQC